MPGFSQLKNYFHFNRGERNGLVVLFSILMGIVFVNLCLPILVAPHELDYSPFESAASSFLLRQERNADSLENLEKIKKEFRQAKPGLTPFPFDPNNLPMKQWLKLGLTEKQARVIKNYEKKGGRFRTPQDLASIYSISKEEFQLLLPYIRITNDSIAPDHLGREPVLKETPENLVELESGADAGSPGSQAKTRSSDPDLTPFHKSKPLNINEADTLDLQQLKGIGPSFARRIIRYRDLLGGFARKDQLLEVYGMDTVRFEGFVNDVFVDTLLIRTINVNEAGIKNLMAHPYIEYYVAKLIVSSRQKKGAYANMLEIKDKTGIPEELFVKIKPYLGLQ